MQKEETKIHFGRYVIRLKNESEKNVSFEGIIVNNLKTLEESSCVLNFPSCAKGKLLVIDKCILVIRGEDYPRFAIVVNDRLTEISTSVAEQILRLRRLEMDNRRLESFNQFCLCDDWEDHNGILINPKTMSVPGTLDVLLWMEKRHIRMRKTLFIRFGIDLLCSILKGRKDDDNAVSYVKSDVLFNN